MAEQNEALPVVAHAVRCLKGTFKGRVEQVLKPETTVNTEYWSQPFPLTDHATATAALQEQALIHLTSEGEWIELTGKLRAEVERYKADAERYRWLRNGVRTRQGVTLSGGSRILDKSEQQALVVFHFWCTQDELDIAIDAARQPGAPGD